MACNTGDCEIVDVYQKFVITVGYPLSIFINLGDPVVPWIQHTYTECTLGFMAVEKATGYLVGVTIGNLLTSNPTITQDRLDPANVIRNTIDPGDYKFPFTFVYGEHKDIGTSTYQVGQTSTCNPLYLTPSSGPIVYNQVNAGFIYPFGYNPAVDATAAVFPTNDKGFVGSWNLKQYTYTSLQLSEPMTFATTAELNAITTSTEIFIAGFDQLKKGDCGVQINSVSATYTFSFDGILGTFPFNNLLSFTRKNPECGNPVMGKDVGSTIAAYINGKWKIIGIVIGFDGSTGYGSRIDYIADQLQIEAWDGSMKGFNNLQWNDIFEAPSPVMFKTKPGLNNIKSFEENGVMYKQIGTTTSILP